ncbi:MAG: HAD-IA family hydrolase [Candidatus Sedimenticola sp. (ex Thyasira tokunagai)]
MNSNDFKLLVFDWDGTLMDSEARIIACVRGAARDLQLKMPTDNEVRNIIGLGLKEAVTTLFPGADDDLVARVVVRYRHYFLHADKTPSELFAGAREVLQKLQEQEYMMAVATGKGRQGLDKVLDETGLKPLFLATRCADETLSKPHPEMLLQIMDELGVDGGETLVIGDTEYDMQMAVNAGAHRLAVSYGVHTTERLMQHSPLGCLDDITELTDWLMER